MSRRTHRGRSGRLPLGPRRPTAGRRGYLGKIRAALADSAGVSAEWPYQLGFVALIDLGRGIRRPRRGSTDQFLFVAGLL
jgi:hypothetical protein